MHKIDILKEAARLYNLGWGVHWILPNSKAPVGKWNTGTRKTWDVLKKEYKKGFGLGVLMGNASKVKGGYLANIDVDIKGGKEFLPKAQRALEKLNLIDPSNIAPFEEPVVVTGNGYRIFIVTKTPLQSKKLLQSKTKCVVHMPTTEINDAQRAYISEGLITEKQLADGYRVRPAWEIEFMSHGRQVVLPPSIHPDTKEPYRWADDKANTEELPELTEAGYALIGTASAGSSSNKKGPPFKVTHVDLEFTDLSPEMISIIMEGSGVTNRSDALYSAALSMMRSGFTDDEIASVLTDPEYFLGKIAYAHRKTKDRANAADWIINYTIANARKETGVEAAFAVPISVAPRVEDKEAIKAQAKSLTGENNKAGNWQLKLKRSGKEGDGPPKATVRNIVTILENAVAEDLIKRDSFQSRDFYPREVPWSPDSAGRGIIDDDAVLISNWLDEHYRFAPSKDKVFDAIVLLANKNSFHPIREMFDEMPCWDGVPRIDKWLQTHFGAKNAPDYYISQVFRKWMVASVTRIFEPGKKFDWMIVLQGETGTGKTSFGDILFGEDYYTDGLPPLHDKDAALNLQGQRCIEFGELAQLAKSDLETVKSFVSRRIDKVRPHYGRMKVELKRQCVFIATVDREQYLKDDAGNRRFMPIEIGPLNFDQLIEDRDQLWAEALFIYQNGFEDTLYLEGEAKVFAAHIQSTKMIHDESDFMVEDLLKFFNNIRQKNTHPEFNLAGFKLIDLWSGVYLALNQWPKNTKHYMLAAKALKKIGCIKHRDKTGITWEYPKVE